MEEAGPGAADPQSPAGGEGGRPHAPQDQKGDGTFSSPVLDLSQRGLHHLRNIFQGFNLKQLHLQRNVLCALPKDFFQLLPVLVWLDLRFNRIRALPPGIGAHRHLRTLLLESNPIKALPLELGNVRTLTSLNLRLCPLEFPPQLILQRGPAAVLNFLRFCAQGGPRGPPRPPPVNQSARLWALEDPLLSPNRSGERQQSRGDKGLQPPAPREKGDLLPPGDKQDQRGLQASADRPDRWLMTAEIRRFWKVRQEIVQNQQAGAPHRRLLATELPPNLQAALSSREPSPDPAPLLREKQAVKREAESPTLLPLHQGLVPAKVPPVRGVLGPKNTLSCSPWRASMGQALRTCVGTSSLQEVPSGERSQQRWPWKQERRQCFRGTETLAQVRQAAQDWGIMSDGGVPQEDALKLKVGAPLPRSRPFPTLTASFSRHPQNIFFNTKAFYGSEGWRGRPGAGAGPGRHLARRKVTAEMRCPGPPKAQRAAWPEARARAAGGGGGGGGGEARARSAERARPEPRPGPARPRPAMRPGAAPRRR
ncbi:leucine-rich repeat-containing protein 27 [Sorex fumeus]|uniref:leucine-rich repeat-containing protein 27 n=1 Tax=Sorex fumeus TaxID=62283 RepID=UPI0024AD8FC6|nr:leucine-rich repeat-containing protein 27 [Sorex fumeus]